jgi:hypothetical protein
LFARHVIIQWVTFWVTPFEFAFDMIEAEFHCEASTFRMDDAAGLLAQYLTSLGSARWTASLQSPLGAGGPDYLLRKCGFLHLYRTPCY